MGSSNILLGFISLRGLWFEARSTEWLEDDRLEATFITIYSSFAFENTRAAGLAKLIACEFASSPFLLILAHSSTLSLVGDSPSRLAESGYNSLDELLSRMTASSF